MAFAKVKEVRTKGCPENGTPFDVFCNYRRGIGKEKGEKMSGIFGNMFDLNHDGKMSSFERALEFSFLEEISREDEKDDLWDDEDGEDY